MVVATGHFRRPPRTTPDELQVQLCLPRAEEWSVVNIRPEVWLDGCRYLAANELLPIAELALPAVSLVDEVDPGKLADEYALQAIEHARSANLMPDGYQVYQLARRLAGQGFYVGWFARARGQR